MSALLLSCLLWAAPAQASTKAATMHYLKALMLQHQGNYAQALKEYEAAAALDPTSNYILEQAADLALETGQLSKALELTERLVELDTKSPKGWHLLGNARWARGEAPLAQKAFEEALRLKPDYSEAMFALGNLLNAQSPARARKYFLDYLKANPDHAAEAHYQIALLDQRQGRAEEAVQHLRQAVELEPEFIQARYTLAHLYEVRRDTEAALAEYEAILEREAVNVALLNHIGEIRFMKDEIPAAETYFQRAKAVAPKNPGTCLWLAMIAEQRGDFRGAAAALSDSSALAEEAELNLRLSYYLTQANQLKEAVLVLEAALKRWPASNEIAYFLALGYDDLKESDKAIRLLKDIVARNPDSRDSRFQLGAMFEKLGRIGEAEAEFRALLERRPADASALNYLGYSLADRGLKLAEAQELIRKAVSLEPNNGAYRDSLGWVYYKQGLFAQARDELLASLRLIPEDPTIWEHLGDIQLSMKDSTGAWRSWKLSQAYGPEGDKVLKKLAETEKGLSGEELGERLLAHLGEVQDGISQLGTLCEVSGTVGDHVLQYRGILSYRPDGALTLDLLGPLFVPVFKASLGPTGEFSMGSLDIPGVPHELAETAVRESLSLLRDVLSGRLFQSRPARFHKGWRSQWVQTPQGRIFLDEDRGRMASLQSTEDALVRLTLGDYRPHSGRRVPTSFRLEGKGFSVGFQLSSPNVRFLTPTLSPR